MTIRSTNCGHRHIHPDVQQCRREAVYRALTSSRLPENLRSLLERLLTRTVQLDFAKRYGPLFDFTYSQRLSEVEGHVSRISRSIAEMSLKHKKLLSAIQDDEDEDLVESDDVLVSSRSDQIRPSELLLNTSASCIEFERTLSVDFDFVI